MEMEPSRMNRLEELVNELLKDEPCSKTVKTMMKQTGIEYSTDPLEQINMVLRALHFEIDENQTTAAAKGTA
jgi:hypothetical protein